MQHSCLLRNLCQNSTRGLTGKLSEADLEYKRLAPGDSGTILIGTDNRLGVDL